MSKREFSGSKNDFENILQRVLNFIYKKTVHGPRFLLNIQEDLAKNIIHLEKSIRIHEDSIKEFREAKKENEKKHNIEGIKLCQQLIRIKENLIQDCKYKIFGFRLIGDALAFFIWDSVSIRQFAKHPVAGGFLSGKVGFKYEMQFVQQLAKKMKIFALLNELTNSLHFADISVITADGPSLIELKHNPHPKDFMRTMVQAQRGEYFSELFKKRQIKDEKIWALNPSYASPNGNHEGTLVLSKGKPGKKHIAKENNINKVNVLAKDVLEKQKNQFFTPDGIVGYLVCKPQSSDIPNALGTFGKGSKQLICSSLSDRITSHPEILPFTKFFDAEVSSAIAFGELEIIVMVNDMKLSNYLKRRGLKAPITKQEHFLINGVSYREPNVKGRIFLEYPLNHVLYAFDTPESFANFYESLNYSQKKKIKLELSRVGRSSEK